MYWCIHLRKYYRVRGVDEKEKRESYLLWTPDDRPSSDRNYIQVSVSDLPQIDRSLWSSIILTGSTHSSRQAIRFRSHLFSISMHVESLARRWVSCVVWTHSSTQVKMYLHTYHLRIYSMRMRHHTHMSTPFDSQSLSFLGVHWGPGWEIHGDG